jgi:hypothetical protein
MRRGGEERGRRRGGGRERREGKEGKRERGEGGREGEGGRKGEGGREGGREGGSREIVQQPTAKTMYCSWRGLEFGSLHPHCIPYNHL